MRYREPQGLTRLGKLCYEHKWIGIPLFICTLPVYFMVGSILGFIDGWKEWKDEFKELFVWE